MKFIFKSCVGFLFVFISTVYAQQKLKWAHVYETSEPFHTEAVWAAAEIKKRTQGKYDIQVFPASSLGKETDINQGLVLGTIDIILTGAGRIGSVYPRFNIAFYPYTFRDAEHLLIFAKSPLFKELITEFREKTGIQMTAFAYYGIRHTTAIKAFNNCSDIKGLKIRVPDIPSYTALWQACGANPTPIAFAEVYLALQNGTVDAQENPLPSIEAKKFDEVQKAIMLTGHLVDSQATLVGPHLWNKLNASEKQIFFDVMQEAATKATYITLKRESELVEAFKKKSIIVKDVDKNSFKEALLKNKPLESMGLNKNDYARIQAAK
ncbi:MAG: sialic acid TRAP transporter substrate-binding protein SiaP [Burkholderiaceae bacterium]